jgi:cobalt/nickel transport protein
VKRFSIAFSLVLAIVTLTITPALGHFGGLIPSDDIVSGGSPEVIRLEARYFHPMEGEFMQMDRPAAFGVLVRGKQVDISKSLVEKKIQGHSTWVAEYEIKKPGDHIFFFEPVPYWEPAEGSFIVHYTKVVVGAFGLEDGWDSEIGLKTEIVPLTRPYGLWTGNVFTGVVKREGKPVPFAEVEVEYLNSDGIVPPADPYITQVVKADAGGVFTYAMPREGWWGFAALSEDDVKLEKDGKEYPVEIGAVIWVRTRDMK